MPDHLRTSRRHYGWRRWGRGSGVETQVPRSSSAFLPVRGEPLESCALILFRVDGKKARRNRNRSAKSPAQISVAGAGRCSRTTAMEVAGKVDDRYIWEVGLTDGI